MVIITCVPNTVTVKVAEKTEVIGAGGDEVEVGMSVLDFDALDRLVASRQQLHNRIIPIALQCHKEGGVGVEGTHTDGALEGFAAFAIDVDEGSGVDFHLVGGVGFPFCIETVGLYLTRNLPEKELCGQEEGVHLYAEVYLGEIDGVKRLFEDKVYVLIRIHGLDIAHLVRQELLGQWRYLNVIAVFLLLFLVLILVLLAIFLSVLFLCSLGSTAFSLHLLFVFFSPFLPCFLVFTGKMLFGDF